MSLVYQHEFLYFYDLDCINGVCTFGDTAMVEAPINRIKEHLREALPATRQVRGCDTITRWPVWRSCHP
jgi:hypothetical protein